MDQPDGVPSGAYAADIEQLNAQWIARSQAEAERAAQAERRRDAEAQHAAILASARTLVRIERLLWVILACLLALGAWRVAFGGGGLRVDTIICHLAAAIEHQQALNADVRTAIQDQCGINERLTTTIERIDVSIEHLDLTQAHIETLLARMIAQSENGREV